MGYRIVARFVIVQRGVSVRVSVFSYERDILSPVGIQSPRDLQQGNRLENLLVRNSRGFE